MEGLGRARTFILGSHFDSENEAARSSQRHRRAILTAIAVTATRGTAMLVGLVSVPLCVGYLKPERYGLWITLSSFSAFLSLADFGIGNGVLNTVAEANGRNDRHAAIRVVSSGFFMLIMFAAAVLAVFSLIAGNVPVDRIFNVTSKEAIEEAGPAFWVFTSCFAATIPVGIVQRVQLGYQEGFITQFWQTLGNVCLASTTFSGQRQLLLPPDDNYLLDPYLRSLFFSQPAV